MKTVEQVYFNVGEVAHVVGVSRNTINTWLKRGLKLDSRQRAGWRKYKLRDVLRVCAWAETARVGIAPNQAADLTGVIEAALLDFSEGRGGADKRFVVATVFLDPLQDGKRMHMSRATPSELTLYLAGVSEEPSLSSFIVVDAVKLWRRVSRHL